MKKSIEFVTDEETTAIKKASKWLAYNDNKIVVKEMISGPNGSYLRIAYELKENQNAAE